MIYVFVLLLLRACVVLVAACVFTPDAARIRAGWPKQTLYPKDRSLCGCVCVCVCVCLCVYFRSCVLVVRVRVSVSFSLIFLSVFSFICGGQEAPRGVLATEDTRAAAVKTYRAFVFHLNLNCEFPF